MNSTLLLAAISLAPVQSFPQPEGGEELSLLGQTVADLQAINAIPQEQKVAIRDTGSALSFLNREIEAGGLSLPRHYRRQLSSYARSLAITQDHLPSPDLLDAVAEDLKLKARHAAGAGQTKVWTANEGGVAAMAADPTGQTLISVGNRDRLVNSWNLDTGKRIWSVGITGHGEAVAFSPDARFAIIVEGRQAKFLDAETGALRDSKVIRAAASQIAFARKDARFPERSPAVDHLPLPESPYAVVFVRDDSPRLGPPVSPDGNFLLVRDESDLDHRVQIFDLTNGESKAIRLPGDRGALAGAGFIRFGQEPSNVMLVARNVAPEEPAVFLYNWRSDRILRTWKSKRPLSAIAVSPDGTRCAYLGSFRDGDDGDANCWLEVRNAATGFLHLRTESEEFFEDVQFTPDGQRVIMSASNGNTGRTAASSASTIRAEITTVRNGAQVDNYIVRAALFADVVIARNRNQSPPSLVFENPSSPAERDLPVGIYYIWAEQGGVKSNPEFSRVEGTVYRAPIPVP